MFYGFDPELALLELALVDDTPALVAGVDLPLEKFVLAEFLATEAAYPPPLLVAPPPPSEVPLPAKALKALFASELDAAACLDSYVGDSCC